MWSTFFAAVSGTYIHFLCLCLREEGGSRERVCATTADVEIMIYSSGTDIKPRSSVTLEGDRKK